MKMVNVYNIHKDTNCFKYSTICSEK